MLGVCDRFGRDDAQGKEMGKLGMGGRMLWEPRILWAGTDRDGGAKERGPMITASSNGLGLRGGGVVLLW